MKKKQKKNLLFLLILLGAGIFAWFAYSRLLYPTESAPGMLGLFSQWHPEIKDRVKRDLPTASFPTEKKKTD